MAFSSVNEPGAHFKAQLLLGEDHSDVFAVIAVPADGPILSPRALRSHFRTVVMPHVFDMMMLANFCGIIQSEKKASYHCT